MSIADKIWPALIIQCSYCANIETFVTEKNPTQREKKLFLGNLALWKVNEYGAVKCPPCQWKEEDAEKS